MPRLGPRRRRTHWERRRTGDPRPGVHGVTPVGASGGEERTGRGFPVDVDDYLGTHYLLNQFRPGFWGPRDGSRGPVDAGGRPTCRGWSGSESVYFKRVGRSPPRSPYLSVSRGLRSRLWSRSMDLLARGRTSPGGGSATPLEGTWVSRLRPGVEETERAGGGPRECGYRN